MIKLIFVLFTIFSLATARTNSPSKPQNNIQTAFQRSKLVPDILSYPVCVPSQLLQVKYGRKEVNLGNAFTLAEVKNGPQVQWKADSKALYTLAMGEFFIWRKIYAFETSIFYMCSWLV